MVKKLVTYFWYFYEYIRQGDFKSVRSAIRYLIHRKSHSSDRLIRTSIGMFHCRKNTNDFQFANYYYEWSVKKFILKHAGEFTVFIDGGACIGDYSILLANCGLRCFAFEPVRNNFDSLVVNIGLNEMDSQIVAFPYALGDHSSTVGFYFDPVNTGASRVSRGDTVQNCTAEVRTFDSFVSNLHILPADNVLFKMDIEGMEPEALEGARGFVRNVPNLTFVIEYKHSEWESVNSTLNSLGTFEVGIIDAYNLYAKKVHVKNR